MKKFKTRTHETGARLTEGMFGSLLK